MNEHRDPPCEVIDLAGTRLKPMAAPNACAMVGRGRARVVSSNPFTIQLLKIVSTDVEQKHEQVFSR
jgi:hypothetical protein